MTNTSYSSINSLDEFYMIGGNDLNIILFVVDEDGVAVDLTGSTCTLKVSPYGQPTSVLTTLTGTVSVSPTNKVTYILPGSTTELMVGGKYMYQPIIVDTGAKEYRPKQGTFSLVQAIGELGSFVDVPASAFYVEATGTNNYNATTTAITSYYKGLSIILTVENDNTTASDLTLSSVAGTKDLKKYDSSGTSVVLVEGDLLADRKYFFVYDGVDWIYVNYLMNSDLSQTIHISTEKNILVDLDEFGIWDSVSETIMKVPFISLKEILLPYGYLANGKIVSTVNSNNLTVSLKTKADGDPSSTDPIFIRIGDSTRTISSAISVTKNAGTNWADLGGITAALEQDVFLYACWNTNLSPDAVDIFWSRIPWGRRYSDFSSTSTDRTYAAVGTTAPASTDDCVLIGRFAATLSGTYNWSVPTYTTINLIQSPVYETRILQYTPVFINLTVGSGTLTGKYSIMNRFLSMTSTLIFAADTSIGGTGVTLSLPFARTAFYSGSTRSSFGLVRLNDATGLGYAGLFQSAPSSDVGAIVAQKTDSTYLTFDSLTSTVPFTWATNDQILIDNVRYSIG